MMIGVAIGDTLRPVKLLGQNKSYQLMREYKRGQRPDIIGTRGEGIIDSIRTSDYHDNRASAGERTFEQLR